MTAVLNFLGVGEATITAVEEAHCRWSAARCAAAGGWMYSGNCSGADVAFQRGAHHRGIAWLPAAGGPVLHMGEPLREPQMEPLEDPPRKVLVKKVARAAGRGESG